MFSMLFTTVNRMSSSQLELIRLNHELVEKYEIAIGDELDLKPNGQKAKVWQQHKLKGMITGITKHSVELKRLYEDSDKTLQEELAVLRTPDLTSFYTALKASKEYFDTFPNADSSGASDLDIKVDVKFSGEEIFGKYLDLNDLHLQFSNVIKRAGIEQDYLQYLERFNDFFYLPEVVKQSKAYSDYLDNLWTYLADFFQRINPLSDWSKIMEGMKTGAPSSLLNPKVNTEANRSTNALAPQSLRLGMFNTPGELEALGMDRLKEALEALGLKCGGTLQDRANRLWSVRGKKPEDIPANLRAKDPGANKKRKLESIVSGDEPDSVTWKEYRIKAVCDLMSGVVNATVRHAEKQQTRTAEEREAELREEEFGLAQLPQSSHAEGAKKGEDDDDDAPVYNPLNLPLGWDGKPIPYWMYKLHGLGVEYKCQICGDHSYWGRRAFDKHFQEWKHAHGMRSLGIPNTKHFHDITLIADAKALYEKIRAGIQVGQFQGEMEEEFEDTQGNVLNRRTYEDLARQGLL